MVVLTLDSQVTVLNLSSADVSFARLLLPDLKDSRVPGHLPEKSCWLLILRHKRQTNKLGLQRKNCG